MTMDDCVLLEDEAVEDAIAYLNIMGDDQLLKFIKMLPFIADHVPEEKLTMADLVYEALLQPYLVQAWKTVRLQSCPPDQITKLSRAIKMAETQLERHTGRKRRLRRAINVGGFLRADKNNELPL